MLAKGKQPLVSKEASLGKSFVEVVDSRGTSEGLFGLGAAETICNSPLLKVRSTLSTSVLEKYPGKAKNISLWTIFFADRQCSAALPPDAPLFVQRNFKLLRPHAGLPPGLAHKPQTLVGHRGDQFSRVHRFRLGTTALKIEVTLLQTYTTVM